MKNRTIFLMLALTALIFSGCNEEGPEGPPGQDGLDTEVYYSEWFSPSSWSGESGDWYFTASAPDLTQNIVEGGVILAYVSLADDIYPAAVRPLPAYAVGANWDFLIPDYELIEFTSDMIEQPLTSGNSFRFIAIPGNIPALKSASFKNDLKNMSYQEVCKRFGIPE